MICPVVPPDWVKLAVLYGPVEWETGENQAEGDWLMLYTSTIENGEIVTRLREGSQEPVPGWLLAENV